MNRAATSRPTAAHPRRVARRATRRVAGVNAVATVLLAVAIPAGPAAAQATTRAPGASPANPVSIGSLTATPTPGTPPATAPASTPALPSHGNDIPAPGFTEGDGAGSLQAVLVVAIPAVPAIVMAFVVFWPRTRQPRSRLAETGSGSVTTSGAGA